VEDQPQRTRAGQYAICANALTRVSGGAEAVFDQALTNGLAAIVAHAWPGAELEGGANRVRSAAALLDVIKQCGKPAENGTIRVLHDPSGPEYGEPSPFDNEPWPNFTSVNGARELCLSQRQPNSFTGQVARSFARTGAIEPLVTDGRRERRSPRR